MQAVVCLPLVRHSREGVNPVTFTHGKAKSLVPRLRGDDDFLVQLSKAN
jgi:hypothetical protein